MAQETPIHRVDAQLAHTTPDPVDPALAIDGIDELADVFLPHAGARGITGTGETVHLHATDDVVAAGQVEGGEWTFRFHEAGVDVERGHAKGDMAVRGPAGQLLLFAWNRRPVSVECFGETDPLDVLVPDGADLISPASGLRPAPPPRRRGPPGSSPIHSACLSPTSFTHHARASERDRAIPASIRVSRTCRSSMSRRVMTGTLATVNRRSTSPQRTAQETLRSKVRSATEAMAMRASRVDSRKPSMRAAAAARRASSSSPSARAGAERVPTTRISSRSARTSSASNHVSSTRPLNHAAASAACFSVIMITTLPDCLFEHDNPPSDGSFDRCHARTMTAPPVDADLLAWAVELTKEAGRRTLTRFRSDDLAIEAKGDGTPVTEADKDAEAYIRAELAAAHPDDAVLGEEEGDQAGTTGRRWIIDPIDGTKAFMRGVPLYSNLLAVEDEHGWAVGVINLPAAGECVYAGRGLGAFQDDRRGDRRPARVGARSSEPFLTASGFTPLGRRGAAAGQARRAGACGPGATGSATPWWPPVASTPWSIPSAALWDIAPMPVVLAEAGGRFSSWSGSPDPREGSGVATNGEGHDELLALLRGDTY